MEPPTAGPVTSGAAAAPEAPPLPCELAASEGVSVGVCDGVVVVVASCVGDRVGLTEGLVPSERVVVGLDVSLGVSDALTVELGDCSGGVGEEVCDGVGVLLLDAPSVTDGVELLVGLLDAVVVELALCDVGGVALAVALASALP